MIDLHSVDFDTLTPSAFSDILPDLFASGTGKLSEEPRATAFLAANPDCAALVKDLEAIAEAAKSLMEPTHEPSEDLWSSIASKLAAEGTGSETVDSYE